MFALIRSSASGSEDLEAPEFNDLLSGIIVPAAGGLIGTGVVWVPGVVYWFFLKQGSGSPLTDPVLWILAIVGLIYMPMALMAAATNSGFLRMLNPVYMFVYIKRLGADYALAVFTILVLCVPAVLIGLLSALLYAIPLPILPGILAASVRLLVPFMMARVLGLLLYMRGAELGLSRAADYEEPLLPGVVPRGTASQPGDPSSNAAYDAVRWAPIEVSLAEVPPSLPAAAALRRRAPIELDPEALPPLAMAEREDAPLARRHMIVELDASALPPFKAEAEGEQPQVKGAAAAIIAAVGANTLAQAVILYGSASLDDSQLPTQCHLAVGQAAATQGDFTLAIRALKAAAKDQGDQISPKAFVLLARVYGEKLGDLATAEKIYRHVVQRFPGSPAAQFAQSRMGARA
jgi:hypothetical protein